MSETLSAVTTGHETPPNDPAETLQRRGCLVLLVGGFLVFQVPRAIAGLVNGGGAERVGGALSLVFFAWLTWRTTLPFRNPAIAANPHYWTISGLGYAVLAALFVSCYGWLLVTQQQEVRGLVSMTVTVILVLGLTALTFLAGRKARAHLSA